MNTITSASWPSRCTDRERAHFENKYCLLCVCFWKFWFLSFKKIISPIMTHHRTQFEFPACNTAILIGKFVFRPVLPIRFDRQCACGIVLMDVIVTWFYGRVTWLCLSVFLSVCLSSRLASNVKCEPCGNCQNPSDSPVTWLVSSYSEETSFSTTWLLHVK